MSRALSLCLALCAVPALAQEAPNLSAGAQSAPGSATQLVLAQASYAQAMTRGEVLLLLAAIRLARGVTLRPATGWERVEVGATVPEAPPGRTEAPDPGGAAALAIAQNLAGDDPDLMDLVFDLDAQVPRGRSLTAVEMRADLAPGQSDIWRLPLFGEVAAEIALIGDGDGPLSLQLTDEAGNTLCSHSASASPLLCRLTPARNGFFRVTVQNTGATVNSYRLIGN
jgi:hypothetical protein